MINFHNTFSSNTNWTPDNQPALTDGCICWQSLPGETTPVNTHKALFTWQLCPCSHFHKHPHIQRITTSLQNQTAFNSEMGNGSKPLAKHPKTLPSNTIGWMQNNNQIHMEVITTNKPNPIVVEQLLAHILRQLIILEPLQNWIAEQSATDTQYPLETADYLPVQCTTVKKTPKSRRRLTVGLTAVLKTTLKEKKILPRKKWSARGGPGQKCPGLPQDCCLFQILL